MRDLPKFIVVFCLAPRGEFRRGGLVFTNKAWRPLEIDPSAEKCDLSGPVPVVTPAVFEAIDKVSKPQKVHDREQPGPPMLSWRPATQQEVAALLEAEPVGDHPLVVADMKAKLADLEARVLRAELGGGPPPASVDAAVAERDREIAHLREELAAREAADKATNERLAKLEAMLAARDTAPPASSAPAAPPPPAAPPADLKTGKSQK